MSIDTLARFSVARLACVAALAILAGIVFLLPTVAAEDATQPLSTGIVPTDQASTEPVLDQSNGDTGDDEPLPDVIVTEEPQQGDGRDPDAVAPGFVTLVIFTSDGSPTSDNTVACVGSICQPAGGLASGTKLVFDDIDPGWRDVTVETSFRGGYASTSVQVAAGQGSRVELTLVVPTRETLEEPEPTPVSATGPLRTAPARTDTADQSSWGTASSVVVTSMPSTGAVNQPSQGQGPLLIATVLALAAFASGLAAHITSRSRPTTTAWDMAATSMPGYHRTSTVHADVPGLQVRPLNGRSASSVHTEVTSAGTRSWARGRRVRSRS